MPDEAKGGGGETADAAGWEVTHLASELGAPVFVSSCLLLYSFPGPPAFSGHLSSSLPMAPKSVCVGTEGRVGIAPRRSVGFDKWTGSCHPEEKTLLGTVRRDLSSCSKFTHCH